MCPDGYTGNALISCYEIGCRSNNECLTHESCINKKCVDACSNIKCAPSAFCQAKNHLPRYYLKGLITFRIFSFLFLQYQDVIALMDFMEIHS